MLSDQIYIPELLIRQNITRVFCYRIFMYHSMTVGKGKGLGGELL